MSHQDAEKNKRLRETVASLEPKAMTRQQAGVSAALAKWLHLKMSTAQNLPYNDGDTCEECEEAIREELLPLLKIEERNSILKQVEDRMCCLPAHGIDPEVHLRHVIEVIYSLRATAAPEQAARKELSPMNSKGHWGPCRNPNHNDSQEGPCENSWVLDEVQPQAASGGALSDIEGREYLDGSPAWWREHPPNQSDGITFDADGRAYKRHPQAVSAGALSALAKEYLKTHCFDEEEDLTALLATVQTETRDVVEYDRDKLWCDVLFNADARELEPKVHCTPEAGKRIFDNLLAAHDQKVRAAVLREADERICLLPRFGSFGKDYVSVSEAVAAIRALASPAEEK